MHTAPHNDSSRRILVDLSPDEADALLNLLLNTPPNRIVSEEMAESILQNLADACRASARRSIHLRTAPIPEMVPQAA
ncbi:MAG: hypothetical protein ACKO5K_07115 [Armatimonadota bacterium]